MRSVNSREISVSDTIAWRQRSRGRRLIRFTMPFSGPPTPKRNTTCEQWLWIAHRIGPR